MGRAAQLRPPGGVDGPHDCGVPTLAPQRGRAVQLLWGGAVALGVPALCAALAWGTLALLGQFPLLHFATSVFLCKSTFALRALGEAGQRMRQALGGDLQTARGALQSLCSRDATHLQAPELIAATVESVAENTSDSFVAPLLFYAVAGLPGAVAYRAINTLDAMIGYHGRYEYLGKAAARLDDVCNYIPARLTALLLLAAGALRQQNVRRGWRILRRDAGRTESPNAGHPMAAMAGLLGVVLSKPQHYALGDAHMPLHPTLIDSAWRTVRTAAWLTLGGAAALCVIAAVMT